MDRIDEIALATFGSLLDPREQPVIVVPGTWDPATRPAVPIGLLVTDQRIVVGADDDGTITCFALRDRRLRIAPESEVSSQVAGSLACAGLHHMYFPVASYELLEEADAGAAAWDQIDGGQLGVLTADSGGAYRLVESPAIFPSFSVELDGSMPVDVLAWTVQVVADPERYLADALVAVSAEYLPLKNENWLSDGETPLSEVEFRRRLKLASAGVATAESVEFFFDDDGMFGHHSVVATSFDRGTTWSLNLFG